LGQYILETHDFKCPSVLNNHISASSDDFGDAGKTLRNLLERQRKKIQQGNPYQWCSRRLVVEWDL